MSSRKNLKKVRGFIFNLQSSEPERGVVVLIKYYGSGNSELMTKPLGSDQNGYFSFNLTKFLKDANFLSSKKISLTVKGSGISIAREVGAILIKGKQLILKNDAAFVLSKEGKQYYIDNKRMPSSLSEEVFHSREEIEEVFPEFETVYWESVKYSIFDNINDNFLLNISVIVDVSFKRNSFLPSIDFPDNVDKENAVKSFSKTISEKICKDTPCSPLAPTDLLEREFYFYDIEKINKGFEGKSTTPITDKELAQLEKLISELKKTGSHDKNISEKLEQQIYEIRKKHDFTFKVIEYAQSWYPIGYATGDISYSLALAPGESANIAVIDWKRSNLDTNAQSSSYNERLDHEQLHSRDIEDTVNSTLNEVQAGFSLGAGYGASSKSTDILSNILATTTGRGGGELSYSTGSRNLTGNSTQKIADSVVQHSSYNRNLNSTVIVQSDQEVSQSIRARTITNNNHCHALTIQYFEVNRIYKVVTEKIGERKAIALKFIRPNLSDIDSFNSYIMKNFGFYRNLFSADPMFSKLLDSFVRKVYDTQGATTDTGGTNASNDIKKKIHHYKIKIKLGYAGLGDGGTNNIQYNDGANSFFLVSNENGPNAYERSFDDNKEYVSNYPTSPNRINSVNSINQVLIETIKTITITAQPGNDWVLQGLYVSAYNEDGIERVIVDQRDLARAFNNANQAYSIDVSPEPFIHPVETDSGSNDSESIEEDYRLLKDFITSNLFVLSKYRWLLMDKDERFYEILGSYENQLTEELENTIIGFMGEYAIFPIKGKNAQLENSPEEPETRYISLPSRGVFAETMLSNCNACEKRDVTRYWDWKESPVRPAAEISGLTPQDYTQTVNTSPNSFPGNVLNIQTPTVLPNPTDLSAAFNLLGQKDIFSDMSKATELNQLLNGLASGTISPKEAQDRAKSIQQKTSPLGSASVPTGVSNSGTNSAAKLGGISPQQIVDYGSALSDYSEKAGNTPAEHKILASDFASGNYSSQNEIDYVLDDVFTVLQESSNTCWAASAAIMISARDGRSISPSVAAQMAGLNPDLDTYLSLYLSNKPLMEEDQIQFANNLQFEIDPPMNYSVRGIAELLQECGPLWVQNDETPNDPSTDHFRVIYGIKGDGTPAGTILYIADPAKGNVQESFAEWSVKYDRTAGEANDFAIISLVQIAFAFRRRKSGGASGQKKARFKDITLADGSKVTIIFDSTADGVSADNEVSEDLVKAVEETIKEVAKSETVTSITIKATTNGVHGANSNHSKSTALDINKINGKAVKDNEGVILKLQDEFERRAGKNENFGPNYIKKKGVVWDPNAKPAYKKLQDDHLDHIHWSIK